MLYWGLMLVRLPRRDGNAQMKLLHVFLSALCSVALSEEAKPDTTAPVLVKPDEIKATLIPEKTTIMLGEPTRLSFLVTNKSNLDLDVIVGGDYENALGRPDSFKVTVVDENQKPVPQPVAEPDFGGMFGPQKLPANGSYAFSLFLPHWATFEKTGSYTIMAERKLELGPYVKGNWDPQQKRTAHLAQAEAKIEVVALDSVKMGQLIEEYGRAFLTNDGGKAGDALSYIHDERTLPFLLKALETNSYSQRFAAIQVLAKYNSDRALDGLKKSMGTTGADFAGRVTRPELGDSLADNIRHGAACALSQSPHPGAIPFLLTQRHDSYYGVRLDVVHALGKMKAEAAVPMLTEMTGDQNEMVSGEARRYLKLFGVESPKK
jgi:hypothetical protein